VSDNRLDIFCYTPPYGPEDMQREIDILRAALAKSNAERDEARREICKRISTTRWHPQFPLMSEIEYAEARGWDCFKEDGKH
jgi:hypothetical protein